MVFRRSILRLFRIIWYKGDAYLSQRKVKFDERWDLVDEWLECIVVMPLFGLGSIFRAKNENKKHFWRRIKALVPGKTCKIAFAEGLKTGDF
jgi:hypothetical protein